MGALTSRIQEDPWRLRSAAESVSGRPMRSVPCRCRRRSDTNRSIRRLSDDVLDRGALMEDAALNLRPVEGEGKVCPRPPAGLALLLGRFHPRWGRLPAEVGPVVEKGPPGM